MLRRTGPVCPRLGSRSCRGAQGRLGGARGRLVVVGRRGHGCCCQQQCRGQQQALAKRVNHALKSHTSERPHAAAHAARRGCGWCAGWQQRGQPRQRTIACTLFVNMSIHFEGVPRSDRKNDCPRNAVGLPPARGDRTGRPPARTPPRASSWNRRHEAGRAKPARPASGHRVVEAHGATEAQPRERLQVRLAGVSVTSLTS